MKNLNLPFSSRKFSRRFSVGRLSSFLFLFSLLFFAACSNDDDNAGVNEATLRDVVEALGGVDQFNQINSLSCKIDGSTYEHEQVIPTEPSPLNGSNHRFALSTEFNQRKARIDYEFIKYNHPFVYDTYDAVMIINDKKGTISGEYNWSSFYFGWTDPISLRSSRIEATLKNIRMSNPLELLKEVQQNGSLNTSTQNGEFVIPTRIADLNIRLVVDPATKMPVKANVMETDFIQGDVLFEVAYHDWITVNGLKYPSRIEYTLDSEVLKTEQLSNIELGVTFNKDHFRTENANQVSFNEENADFGFYYSQWYHRWLAWGIPIDQPLNNGALALENFDLASFGIPDQTIGPNLKIFGRPDLRTWTVVAKTPEGLVIFEPPLNSQWTRSILNAVSDEFPGEPVIGGVVSHTHHEHCGGLRELGYETGKLFVGADGVDFVQKSLDSKHNLLPDNLALNPRPVEIEAVDDVTILGGGAVEIHLLKPDHSDADPHATDMLVMYVPEYEALIEADHLWPGEFMAIWNRETHNTYTPLARKELRKRAKHLLDYINEKNLKVSKVIGIHGGLGTIEDLEVVAR